MRRSHLLLALFAVVATLVSATPAVGQKPSADPRPLTGLDASAIPTYTSVEAWLQSAQRGGLLEAATPIGHVTSSSRRLDNARPLTSRGPAPRAASTMDAMRIRRAENGTAAWITGSLPVPKAGIGVAGKATSEQYREGAFEVMETLRDVMRLDDPREELRSLGVVGDDLGYTHARFEQTYRGVPVWGRDLYVHFDPSGEPYAINGTYEPTPNGVDTRPALTADAATDRAVDDLKAAGRWAPLPAELARTFEMPETTSRLVIYPDTARALHLAYEVSVHPNIIEWYTYIVDARDGTVLTRIARHCSVNHAAVGAPVIHVEGGLSKGMPQGTSQGTSQGTFVNAQGVDLNGVARNFRAYHHDDGFYYSAWDLPNFDAANSTMPNGLAGGALTLSLNNSDFNTNQLFHVTSNNNTWPDASGVSAAVNMSIAYDYFKSVHGRNAIDGLDQSIVSVLHATDGGAPMDNAFWNGRFMVYGDGAQTMKPLAGGLDVAAHEMSHGVIEHTAALVYQFQSGALNESFADVFGAMVDRDDLLMGEDIMKTDPALRDLLNPDNPQLSNPQPAHMNDYWELTADQDAGGVHINSGIPNRAAALLIEAIGREKVERVYYRALSNYLTRNSQFGDARAAVVQSAVDLYGSGSAEDAAARQAFTQVGITDGTKGEGGGGGGTVPATIGGASLLAFMDAEGAIGYLDLSDPQNVERVDFEDPNAVARADASTGDMSQLSTPSNGERIWFVGPDRLLYFIEMETSEVMYFPDLNVQSAGDLWTASVAPDESYVALVSAYANDPRLYLFDGTSLATLDLKVQGTQEGVLIETIQYPDVVSWSPNPDVPRLAFDAFNSVNIGLGNVPYWGMYEYDFGVERIYNLVPAQSSGVSVGNVTYSTLSGDLIAFNHIDDQGVFDILIGDFANGQNYALGLPEYQYDGTAITDAQRPTFAPNDAMLAFASPGLKLFLFYEPTGPQLSALELSEPLYNPHWFVRGGQPVTDTDDVPGMPATAVLHGSYPNPTSGASVVRIELPMAADVRLDVYDILGRRVRTVDAGHLPAGPHEVRFDAAGLVAGTYFVGLNAGGTMMTTKLVVAR